MGRNVPSVLEDKPLKVVVGDAGMLLTIFASSASTWVQPLHHPPEPVGLAPAHHAPYGLSSLQQPEGTHEHLNQLLFSLPTALQGSHLPGVKAQVLPKAHKTLHDLSCSLPALPSLPFSPPLTPQGPLHCSCNISGTILPQDLCTGSIYPLFGTPFFQTSP